MKVIFCVLLLGACIWIFGYGIPQELKKVDRDSNNEMKDFNQRMTAEFGHGNYGFLFQEQENCVGRKANGEVVEVYRLGDGTEHEKVLIPAPAH